MTVLWHELRKHIHAISTTLVIQQINTVHKLCALCNVSYEDMVFIQI